MSETSTHGQSHQPQEVEQDPYRWVILGMCFVLNFFAHFSWLSIPIFIPQISSDVNISIGVAQTIYSTVALSIAFLDIPGGFLNDRFPGRWIVGLGGIIVGIAGVIQWVAPSFFGLIVSSVLIGIAIGLLYPGTVNLLSEWFSPVQLGRAQGVNVVAFTLGGAVGQTLSSSVMPQLVGGWQNTFLVYGVLALIASGLWLAFVHSPDPEQKPVTPDHLLAGERGEGEAKNESEESIPELLRGLLTQRVTYLFIATAFFINYMYFGFPDMVPLWSGKMPFSVPVLLSSGTLYLAAAGAVLLPPLADRFGYQRVMSTILITGTIGVIITGYAPILPVFGLGILIAGLSAGGLYAFLFTLPGTHPDVGVGAARTGTMSGLMLSLGHIGAALSPILATKVLTSNSIGVSSLVLGLPLLLGLLSIWPLDIDIHA